MKHRQQRIKASPRKVLALLRASDRGRVWSSLAAELHEIPPESVTIQHVRGVRDACKWLVWLGLAEQQPRGLAFRARV